jgi:hypothetical protein
MNERTNALGMSKRALKQQIKQITDTTTLESDLAMLYFSKSPIA